MDTTQDKTTSEIKTRSYFIYLVKNKEGKTYFRVTKILSFYMDFVKKFGFSGDYECCKVYKLNMGVDKKPMVDLVELLHLMYKNNDSITDIIK